jgi:hypothetical protein
LEEALGGGAFEDSDGFALPGDTELAVLSGSIGEDFIR